MRWLYHVKLVGPLADPYQSREGFIHCSYRPLAAESARLYFPADAALEVLRIDPRGLDIEIAQTPRGPMPHVRGAIPTSAVIARLTIEDLPQAPDEIE